MIQTFRRITPFLWLIILPVKLAAAGVIDLKDAVVVAPDALTGPEKKAVAMLVEEEETDAYPLAEGIRLANKAIFGSAYHRGRKQVPACGIRRPVCQRVAKQWRHERRRFSSMCAAREQQRATGFVCHWQ